MWVWLVGVGLLLGLKYIMWGWVSKIWAGFANLIYKALSGNKVFRMTASISTLHRRRTARSAFRKEREKDQSEFHDFLDELNKRAVAEITAT